MKNNIRNDLTFFLVLCVIFLCLFIPTMLRARISAGLASYRARIRLQNLPIPAEMQKIDAYNAGDINSIACYLGEAYLLAGTDLDVSDIENFYEDSFAEWNWKVRNEFDSASPYFGVYRETKTYSGRAVEGISIRKCDHECMSSYNFPETIIQDALKKYKSIYVINTWFVPYEVRGHLCWCCSGG
jgi:hypothetical protein